jgi:hypothetical protein
MIKTIIMMAKSGIRVSMWMKKEKKGPDDRFLFHTVSNKEEPHPF